MSYLAVLGLYTSFILCYYLVSSFYLYVDKKVLVLPQNIARQQLSNFFYE